MSLPATNAARAQRPDADRYDALATALAADIPDARLIRDPLRTLAYGTDASFYRLTPRLVVRVESEADVIATIRACDAVDVPYTFRAAGTSLSGQAVSDSVLIQLSRQWSGVSVAAEGRAIRCQPAALGSDANRALAAFGRKIGPDPASIDSAMIGGIAANNASGMCCGNVQDTYHTMASARIVFADGTVLDTGSSDSRRRFAERRFDLVAGIGALAARVKASATLAARIRHKYRIKNTTGYSLHALIDFDDPVDVIARLLIGSEGTLGFISEITFETVPDPAYQAVSLVLFPDIHAACDAADRLATGPVAAVELMDRHSLRAVAGQPGIPDRLATLGDGLTALLVDVRSDTAALLGVAIREVSRRLEACRVLEPPAFTDDPVQSKRLWNVRKGLFPLLGHTRRPGTTILIEDVAFPTARLADAAVDLRALLDRYDYTDAVIFGHALQGNLHFVFCVDFNQDDAVQRYARFMEEIATLVVQEHDGSLKAEHGTGRNMAPFVEREWGSEAVAVMREIKRLFDPRGLLNPDVILTADPQLHLRHLKPTPPSHPLIESCTECGFCERNCPSRHLTLTPRQRIAAWREIARLTASGDDQRRLRDLRQAFRYAGDETCAVDGMCGVACPLGIDTGAFVKEYRADRHGPIARLVASASARHWGSILAATRTLLRAAHVAHAVLGTAAMTAATGWLRRASGGVMPAWNAWVPTPPPGARAVEAADAREAVVYFPSCVSRLFGRSAASPYPDSQNVTIERVLGKARYAVRYPDALGGLCCGMAFESKGFTEIADRKLEELLMALERAAAPDGCQIVIDTSPCALRVMSHAGGLRGRVVDLPDFLRTSVLPRLTIRKRRQAVALHVPCSVRKGGGESRLVDLARACAETVVVAPVACCGFAGDRGLSHPELPASALAGLRAALPPECRVGFSSSRTCEIGTSLHGGIGFQSIACLVDEVTTAAAGHSGSTDEEHRGQP